MPRPAKPPRLNLRDGIWYLVDTANRVRISLRTSDADLAERRLKEYTMNLGSYAPPQEPLVRDLLEGYRLSRLDVLRNRARAQAKRIAARAGLPVEDAETTAQRAAEAVADAGTLEYMITALNRHIGDLRLKTVTSEVARRYRDARRAEGKRNRVKGEVADGTIRRELSVVKAAISWAFGEAPTVWFGPDRLRPSFAYPVAQSEARQEFLDHDDVTTLIVNCGEPHLRLYILLAVQTGARKSAILNLRWQDVDFSRRVIDFGIADTRKRKPIVRMTDILHNALLLAFSCRSVGSSHVIEYHGRAIDNIKKGFRDLVVKCGFDPRHITPHVLKHTYISWLCQAGMPISEIAAYANTTAKTIEKHYQHVLTDRTAQVQQAVSLEFGPSGLGLDPGLVSVDITPTGQATRRPTRGELEQKGLVTANTRRVARKTGSRGEVD